MLRNGLRNLEVQIVVPSKRGKICTSEMPVQVNHLQFYGVSYMLPKCQTGHGAFTYYQPCTRPEINTERADFVSFLWPSSPHSSTGCYQLPGHSSPSCPPMGNQQNLLLFSSSVTLQRGFLWKAHCISGPQLLSLPSIYSTIATHADPFQLFKRKTEYLKGSDFSFGSNK